MLPKQKATLHTKFRDLKRLVKISEARNNPEPSYRNTSQNVLWKH